MDKRQELNSSLVLKKAGKILLLKRHNLIWEFPGGGAEFGEDPETAARRETKEETGLLVKKEKTKLIGATSAVFGSIRAGKKFEKHAVYLVYLASSFSGRITLSREHLEHGWFSISEAKKLKLGLNARPVLGFL